MRFWMTFATGLAAIGLSIGCEGNKRGDEMARSERDVLRLDDPGEVVLRVNCGMLPVMEREAPRVRAMPVGGWAQDRLLSDGGTWGAEGGGVAVREHVLAVHDTPVPDLYRTERFGMDAYVFELPEGVYTLRLHFAETFECVDEAGQRVFDVSVNGQEVLGGFDPYVEAGGFAQPAIYEVRGVRPAEGRIRIGFVGQKQSATICGIEVFRTPEATWGLARVSRPRSYDGVPDVPDCPPDAEPTKVMFVGNSHTFFWNIPGTVRSMVHLGDPEVWIETARVVSGGKTLAWHWNHGAREEIIASSPDVLVLQAADPNRAVESVGRFARLADDAGAKLLLYCTWSEAIIAANEQAARAHRATLVPVGHAWQLARAKHPDLRLIGPDGVHAGLHGSYLTACVFYAALTGQSPEGHPYPSTLGTEVSVDAESAKRLQSVAWQAVESRMGPEAGVLAR